MMTVDFERKTLRMAFADTVAEGVAFGDVSSNPAPVRALVERVHTAVGESLVPYVKAVVVAYQRDRGLTIFHDA